LLSEQSRTPLQILKVIMATKKLQRKKPGYTKAGVAKIVSLSPKQLVSLLENTQKKKIKAKINRRLRDLGTPTVLMEVTVE
jgi:hypothetical protein